MLATQPHFRSCLIAALLAAVGGCCCSGRTPRIDPTGERIFAPAPIKYKPEPGKYGCHDTVCVALTPAKVVAPVGTEVVMVAGVCGQHGHLLARERVEWMLAPGSVGQFISPPRPCGLGWLTGLRDEPHKVDNTFAIGSTGTRYVCLNRGSPNTDDDVPVMRGQTWLTVTSPLEGTSYVTAYAPTVHDWDKRQQTSRIHWVDAEWAFPPPAVNPAGSRHTFTTTVTRHTTHTPAVGWRVRYEITGGPPAGFAPEGAQVIEVPTDSLGQASAEIYQIQPAPGVNTIDIQVVRPAELNGGERLVVGMGSTRKTWSSPDISLDKSGPSQATIGAIVTYKISVRNPAELTAREVVVTDQIGEGLEFVSSTPPAAPGGNTLEWRLGDLQGGEGRDIEVNFRATRPGTINNCASVSTAERLSAQDCAATTILAATLDVATTGPATAEVGQDVTFEIRVTNRGDASANGLILVDRFDAGLEHEKAANPIEAELGSLEPGQTRTLSVTFRAARAGRLCHTVEVHGPGGAQATARACVEVSAGGAGAAPPVGGAPVLNVKKTGPAQRVAGEVAEFVIEITNAGDAAANNLKIVDNYDAALNPIRVTDGYAWTGLDLVWKVDTLPPNKSIRFQVQCRCEESSANSCNRVTVTCDEQVRGDSEACLRITAPPPGLSLTLAEVRNPVTTGAETAYEVRVTNNSPVSDKNVVVVVNVPVQMLPLRVGTSGPAAFKLEGQIVQFEPVKELRAGETLTYKVQVRAQQPGNARCQASLSSDAVRQAVTTAKTTTILSGQ